MNKHARFAASAATIAASLALATPAAAQQAGEIRIGMIDMAIKSLPVKDGNLKVVSRNMAPGAEGRWVGESDYTHGELVAGSAVRSARALEPNAPIKIFAANVYSPEDANPARFGGGRASRGLEDTQKIRLKINFGAAMKAIDWMKAEGVKVLIMTGTGADTEGMRSLNRHAVEAGMVVVASTNNDRLRSPVYPAAYPNVISVAGDDSSLPVRNDPMLAGYVSYVGDALAPGTRKEIGSSFAAGSVGGLVGVYAMRSKDVSEQGAREWLNARATVTPYAGLSKPRITYADYAGKDAALKLAESSKPDVGVDQVALLMHQRSGASR